MIYVVGSARAAQKYMDLSDEADMQFVNRVDPIMTAATQHPDLVVVLVPGWQRILGVRFMRLLRERVTVRLWDGKCIATFVPAVH